MNWFKNLFKKQYTLSSITIDPNNPPSSIELRWDDYGPISKLVWLDEKGKYHNIDPEQPALCRYFENVIIMEYFQHGKRHRQSNELLPTVIRYNTEDNIGYFQYWENDTFLKEEQFYNKKFKF